MRNAFICISTLVLLSLLLACNNKSQNRERDFLDNCIKQINVSDKYQWIVILPGVGCHGCIQDGEYFMKKNVGKNNILFVITKVSSLKILQQKLGFYLSEHSNIYIDKENIFDIPTENSIYPCVVKLEKGNLSTYSFQSPKSHAFQSLK